MTGNAAQAVIERIPLANGAGNDLFLIDDATEGEVMRQGFDRFLLIGISPPGERVPAVRGGPQRLLGGKKRPRARRECRTELTQPAEAAQRRIVGRLGRLG